MQDQVVNIAETAKNAGFEGNRFFANLITDEALGKMVTLLMGKGAGEKIPSERELAETLHVSRTAIRDRISRLEALGVVRRKEREGTFFTGIRPENVSDVLILSMLSQQMTMESLVSVRQGLERQASVEACRTRNLEALEDLGAAVAAMYETDDGQELQAADNAFHRALFSASCSQGLVFFSQMLHAVLSSTVLHVYLEQDRDILRVLHTAILDAILASDEDAATRAMDEHFVWLNTLNKRVHGKSSD